MDSGRGHPRAYIIKNTASLLIYIHYIWGSGSKAVVFEKNLMIWGVIQAWIKVLVLNFWPNYKMFLGPWCFIIATQWNGCKDYKYYGEHRSGTVVWWQLQEWVGLGRRDVRSKITHCSGSFFFLQTSHAPCLVVPFLVSSSPFASPNHVLILCSEVTSVLIWYN